MNGFRLARRMLGTPYVFDIWDSLTKAGSDAFKTYEDARTADEKARAAQAQAQAAAANAATAAQNAITAQALNPTILGMPSGVVIFGGLALLGLGVTLALTKK